MIGQTIERAAAGYAYEQQMANMVIDCVRYSESQFNGIRAKWPRLYDLWRGSWSGRFHPHKNNVHIPLIFSALWADAARKAASSLSTYPPVNFMGYGPDDRKIAQKQEALNAAQFKDDEAFLKQVDLMVSSGLYGVAVMQVGWKRDEQMRIMEQIDRMPLSGKVVRHIRKGNVVMFDGPESIPIDLLDFFPQPACGRLRNMKWVVRRYFLDLDDCRYLASIGTFDKAALDRLEREGAIGGGQSELVTSIRRFQVRTGMDDETARFMDKYSRPIEILEFWGRVPSELSQDGDLNRVVTVANRRYLMRNRPNPYNHGRLPFLAFSPTPDPHHFYAPGKAEIIEKLQIVGNRYLNQSLDAADLMIDPMWFYDRGAGLVTRNLYSRPGRFIGVNGNPNNVIASIQPELQHLQAADAKIGQVREFAQMGTGLVDDAVMGLGGDSRQTAREFVGRREAAGTRLMLESRIYEETMLEPLANMFSALSKQFLNPPVEVLILGDGAQLDPDTGMPIPASRETLSGYDLYPSYSARALGATMGLSKQMQQQNLLSLLQALGTPLGQSLMGQINAVNFFRGIFRVFEVPSINDIFIQNPMLQQMLNNPQLQQMMQGQGLAGIPTSGQIANGGPGVIAGMPGQNTAGRGASATMLSPPDISKAAMTMAPVGAAA
jgi:hypothetical protein